MSFIGNLQLCVEKIATPFPPSFFKRTTPVVKLT